MNSLDKLEKAKFMHQFLDKSLPASFEKYLTRSTFVHRHSTCTSERNDYFLPHFSTSRLQRWIKLAGVKIMSVIRYRGNLKTYLLKSLFPHKNCI